MEQIHGSASNSNRDGANSRVGEQLQWRGSKFTGRRATPMAREQIHGLASNSNCDGANSRVGETPMAREQNQASVSNSNADGAIHESANNTDDDGANSRVGEQLQSRWSKFRRRARATFTACEPYRLILFSYNYEKTPYQATYVSNPPYLYR